MSTEKRRPRQEGGAPTETTTEQIVAEYKPLPAGTTRRRWARQLINQSTDQRPEYGSTAWIMLPDEHADKVAACVVAAECWATTGDLLEEELRQEIELARAAFKRAEDEEYQRRAAEHRREQERLNSRVSTSFSVRRLLQLEAATPRPGDYMGGPVDWKGGDSA
jgi:hypothetical protein